jgi:hypothetical protein
MHPLNPEDLEALSQALPHMRTPKLIDEVTSCLLTGKMLPKFNFGDGVPGLSQETAWAYVEFWAYRIMAPRPDGSASSDELRKGYILSLQFLIDDYIPKHT